MTQVSGNGHKRAVLYARVSTDEQADKGYSLPSQFDAMRKYATQQGFEIAGEFQDDYSGATPIEYRPEGGKAYTMLKSGGADVIIAYTIDRFVRPPEDGDEWDMPILIRGLAKLGKEIHTVRRGKLNTNFADLLIALLDARKAGEERRDIRERTIRGTRAKAKSGRVIGMRAPYGYRHIRDEHGKVVTLEIDETTGRIVRLIFEWYVHGDEHGIRLSARTIAKRLSEMSAPTPGELQRGYHRKRASGMWQTSKVLEIIAHEVYAGVWWYGGRIAKTRKRRPIDEQIAVSVPVIVDRETWERAQAQRTRNKAMAKRNGKRDYLLSGLILCSCGLAMCGEFFSNHQYYSCSWRNNHYSGAETRTCWARSVRADAIEADIWDEIRGLFQDLDRLWADLKAAQQNELTAQDPKRAELEAVEGLLKDTDSDADEIAATMRIAKGKVGERVQKQQDDCNARIAELTARREKLIAELGARKLTDDAIEKIMQFARDTREGIEDATFDDKRRTLENLDVRVTVTPGKYRLKCVIGEKDGEIRKIKRGEKAGIVTSSRYIVPSHLSHRSCERVLQPAA
jgi:site-specific DNA recombinase